MSSGKRYGQRQLLFCTFSPATTAVQIALLCIWKNHYCYIQCCFLTGTSAPGNMAVYLIPLIWDSSGLQATFINSKPLLSVDIGTDWTLCQCFSVQHGARVPLSALLKYLSSSLSANHHVSLYWPQLNIREHKSPLQQRRSERMWTVKQPISGW